MPVNSGASPEAPLGGHTTQFSLGPEPEEFPAPVVAPPPEEVAPPPEAVALELRSPPPPPPVETVPADPLGEVEVEADVEVVLLAAAVVPVVLVVVVLVVVVVVLPGVGFPVVTADGAMVGSAAAPPPAGNPLRVAALPTSPAVEVAVCATAGMAMPSIMAIARIGARVISGQRETL